MQEFRKGPGEYMRDVSRNGLSFLLTRNGKPVAKLIPVDDMLILGRDNETDARIPLTKGLNLGDSY